MKKQLLCCLLICLLLCGCVAPGQQADKRYTATFLDLFDTVTTVVGFSESQEAFSEQAQKIHDELLVYHQLFDIYNSYEGIHNLKTVNDAAGGEAVQVDGKILQLLRDCKAYYTLTGGRVNAAMGSVLKLWHEAREDGYNDPANAALPSEEALQEAALHTDFNNVILNEAASTVRIADPLLRLDVGAIAKGWATQRVAEAMPSGMLISVGGNVCATGPKDEKGTPWVVGIQDPTNANANLHTLNITTGSVVTSGDYQRTYAVDGKLYHHIIDPDTRYPGTLWRSVSIVCEDSGLADALSTALFLLSREDGQALLDQCDARAMWVNGNGEIFYSTGFRELIRS